MGADKNNKNPQLATASKKTACYVTVNMSNVSFETVVRQRVMGCARSSDNDEGQEDTIVRPQPKQEVAVQQDSSRTS